MNPKTNHQKIPIENTNISTKTFFLSGDLIYGSYIHRGPTMKESLIDSAETQRLLEQVRAGDKEAIDQLLVRCRTYLCNVVEMRLGDRLRQRIDASDLVQETQMEAVRRLEEFLRKEPMPFRLWLRQIAHDRLLKAHRRHVRAARRDVTKEVPLPEKSSLMLARQLLSDRSTPSQHVSKREQTHLVRHALIQLPEVDREILLMRHLEELSYPEIGYVLGTSSDAARKRYGRALLHLAKVFPGNNLTEQQI